jgi:hypothetical protein
METHKTFGVHILSLPFLIRPQSATEKIQEDFPWFRHMHALLDGSLVHDTDAYINNNNLLDTKPPGSAFVHVCCSLTPACSPPLGC